MHCARCGEDFPDGSQACPACGLKLRRAAAQQPQRAGIEVGPTPQVPVGQQPPAVVEPTLFDPVTEVEDVAGWTAPAAPAAPVTYEAPPAPPPPVQPPVESLAPAPPVQLEPAPPPQQPVITAPAPDAQALPLQQPLKAPAGQYVEGAGTGRRRAAIIVGVVVVLVALAGGAVFIFMQKQPLSAPERTVQRFWQAVSDRDQEELISLFTPERQSEASRLDIFSRDLDIQSLSTVLSSQEGDEASVDVVDMTVVIDGKEEKIGESGGGEDITFDLKKVKGRWLIENVSGLDF